MRVEHRRLSWPSVSYVVEEKHKSGINETCKHKKKLILLCLNVSQKSVQRGKFQARIESGGGAGMIYSASSMINTSQLLYFFPDLLPFLRTKPRARANLVQLPFRFSVKLE